MINNAGKNNPNYKHGLHCEINYCVCGKEKDYRSELCKFCSGKELQITKEQILEYLSKSKSLLELSKYLNISRQSVTRYIKKYDLDISHFSPGRNRPYRLDQIFCISDTRINGTVKKFLIENKILEYICSECKCKPIWNNILLVLELDHINGNSLDNRIENLRFLCPNCHSQTDTNKGKNSKKKE
jgi:Zn finger protein HypA/HybF involved in hydrogenase expression